MSEKTTGYCGQHHTTLSLDADCPGCEAEEAMRERERELEAQVAEMTAASIEGVEDMRRLIERVAELERMGEADCEQLARNHACIVDLVRQVDVADARVAELEAEKQYVYALVDSSDEEMYYIVGFFSDASSAEAIISETDDPTSLTDADPEGYMRVELWRYAVNKVSPGLRNIVKTWEWTSEYDEAADEYKWTALSGEQPPEGE